MIFKQIPEILDGRKTQTRRLVKDGESLNYFTWWNSSRQEYDDSYGVFDATGRMRWAIGRSYSIQPYRGAAGIGKRIEFRCIRKERLHDITEADARAEGVASVAEYKELWERINGKTKGARWQDNPLVWVITFELVN